MQHWNVGPSDLPPSAGGTTAERRAASVAVVCGTVVAVLTVLVVRVPAGSLDRRFAAWAHARGLGHQPALQHVTDLGSARVVLALAVILCLALHLLRQTPLAAGVPFLAVVLLGEEVLQRIMKEAVGRARPTLEPAAATLGPAFPSGHATTSAAFYAAAALLLARGRPPRSRAALASIAIAVALVVAATRVLLAVHWLTDVAGGLALGWGWVAVCVLAARAIERAGPVS